jgi:hypothetical protein
MGMVPSFREKVGNDKPQHCAQESRQMKVAFTMQRVVSA